MSDSASVDDLSFDSATQIQARRDSATTEAASTEGAAPEGAVFDVTVHPLWTVGDKPNGGYLLALLGRAAAECLHRAGEPALDPISATVTYLAAPALSAAEVHTTVLRRGRTASHVRAVLIQSARTMVDVVFVMGTLTPGGVPRYSDIRPLDIPPPELSFRPPATTPDGIKVGVLQTTDLRLDPATVPFAPQPLDAGPPTAELRGWVRFADGTEPDAGALLYFVDAIPPATLRIGSTGWVPTLSMSVYVRAQPAPGWLGIRFIAHLVEAGMVDESCTLWDSTGQVVAQATQLARLRFPDERSR
jgi:hypothetical protein